MAERTNDSGHQKRASKTSALCKRAVLAGRRREEGVTDTPAPEEDAELKQDRAQQH